MKSIESIKKFHFSIGGYFAKNFDVVIKENKATYCADLYVFDFSKRQEKEISKNQMESFLSKLNQLNIIGWKKEYFNPDIIDGVQWELEMVFNKKTKKAYSAATYTQILNPIQMKLHQNLKNFLMQ